MKYIAFIADGVLYFDQKTGLNIAKACRKSSVLQRADRENRYFSGSTTYIY